MDEDDLMLEPGTDSYFFPYEYNPDIMKIEAAPEELPIFPLQTDIQEEDPASGFTQIIRGDFEVEEDTRGKGSIFHLDIKFEKFKEFYCTGRAMLRNKKLCLDKRIKIVESMDGWYEIERFRGQITKLFTECWRGEIYKDE